MVITHKRGSADPVKFRGRRYSPDKRRILNWSIYTVRQAPKDYFLGLLFMRGQVPLFLKKYGRLLVPISLLLALIVWEGIIRVFHFPAFILPPPQLVWERFIESLIDGSLFRHTSYTLLEVILGLFAGSSLAMIFGYSLAKSRLLEHLLAPYLVASQAIPIIAIAPLLVIWFGTGMTSKVIICALTVFFPILVNTAVGLRAVPDNLRDLMKSLHATHSQTLRYLEVPASLPIVLGGLRIGATLSVIGAIVGELSGADRGLGFLINVGRGQYDTALVFVAVFTLIVMALVLYGIVVFIEKHMFRWQKK